MKHKQRKFHLVCEHSPDAILILDTNYKIGYANIKARKLIKPPQSKLIGRPCFEAIMESDKPCKDCKVNDVLQNKTSHRHLKYTVNTNGKENWLQQLWYPILDKEGNIESIVEIAKDITERKLAEQALIESEEKLRNLFEYANDSIFITDPSTRRFLDVNKNAAEKLGYTKNELLGLKIEDITSNTPVEQIKADIKRIEAGENVIFQTDQKRKDGSELPVEISSHLLQYGGKRFIQSFVRDITERKQAEIKLRESEEMYRFLIEKQGEGISIVDPSERFVYCNPVADEIFGVQTGTLAGRNLREFTSPKTFAVIIKQTKKRQSGVRSTFEVEIIRANNEKRWLLVTATPRFTKDGRFIGAFSIFRDITESKQAEKEREALRRLSQRLSGPLSVKAVGKIMAEESRILFDHNAFSIDILDESNDRLIEVYMEDTAPERKQPEEFPVTSVSIKALINNGIFETKPRLINRRGEPSETNLIPFGHKTRLSRSLMFVPIVWEKQTVSIMSVQSYTPDRFSVRDLELLQMFANQCGGALARAWGEEALRASEERYRNIFQTALVSLWEEDFSEVTEALNNLKAEGITDFKKYFNEHPEFVKKAARMVKVIDINDITLKLFGAKNKDELMHPFESTFLPESSDVFQAELIALAEGKSYFETETVTRTLQGKHIDILIKLSFALRSDGEYDNTLISIMDITEHKQAERRIKASLKEKEVLLKEVHHRVKNNMQVISSMLSLQAAQITDQEYLKMFKESQNRVRSMALIHEKLYQSEDFTKINFSDYLQNMVVSLFNSYRVDSNTIQLKIKVKDVFLDINKGIPCGLIINELVSNALKHAFPNKRKGIIEINLQPQKGGKLTLIVKDNGIGFPKDLDFRYTESLGLQLVNTLVAQLEAGIKLNKRNGTEFRIAFSPEASAFSLLS